MLAALEMTSATTTAFSYWEKTAARKQTPLGSHSFSFLSVYAGTHVYTQAYGSQRPLQMSLLTCHPLGGFSKIGSLVIWNLSCRLGWPTRQPPVPTSSRAGITGACHLAQIFHMGSGDPVPVSVLSRQALCQLSHLHILPFNLTGNLSVLGKSHFPGFHWAVPFPVCLGGWSG